MLSTSWLQGFAVMRKQLEALLAAIFGSILPVTAMVALGLLAGDVRAQPESPATGGLLSIEINNLQNPGKGQLVALVYQQVKRVEVNGVEFFRRGTWPVTGEQLTLSFENLPYGTYAVAVFHDMDKDLRVDTNLIGIPSEDLGVSNNAKGGPLGGPLWKHAKFSHQEKNSMLSIKMWRRHR